MEIETLKSILTKKEPTSRQLISSGVLLENTKLVLYGGFKTGKSTLIQYIAMCLAGGLPLFGSDLFKTIPSKVYYIQLEMPVIPFHRRLKNSVLSQAKAVQDNLFLTTEFWLKLDTEEGRSKLLDAVEQIKPDVVIIDPLYKCTLGGEEYKDLSAIYDHLDLMMDKYGFSLIFTAQGRKTQIIPSGMVDLGDQELRGSTATGGWVDSILGLRRLEGTRRKLTGTLRHGISDVFELTIEYDPSTSLYSLV